MMLLSPVSSTFIPQINVYRVSAREVAGYSQKMLRSVPWPYQILCKTINSLHQFHFPSDLQKVFFSYN